MYNETLVVSAYILDDMSGSEPALSFHFLEEMSKKFKSILVFTSSFTPEEVMSKLNDSCKNISFVQTQFPLFLPEHRFGTFYLKYRIFILRQASQIQKMKLDPATHVGIHYSLSNHLLGTALYKSGIPYLFGPASTSIFPIRYWRIARQALIIEFIRFICIQLVLRFDSVSRKSIKNAAIILAGDAGTEKLLNLSIKSANYFSTSVPHTSVNTDQIDEFSKQSDNRKNILWCGAFSNRKDPRMALEVMKCLRDIHGRQDITLKMYGSGRKFKELLRYKNRYELNNVEILPWIKKDLLIAEMSETKILLMTSFRETGGAQLLEALACGMNVVSTDATGATDWLSDKSIRFLGPSRNSSRRQLANNLALQVINFYEIENSHSDIHRLSVAHQACEISKILGLLHQFGHKERKRNNPKRGLHYYPK